MLTRRRRFLTIAVATLTTAALLKAHDPGLSNLVLKVGAEHLDADLAFASSDLEAIVTLDTDQDGRVTAEEFEATRTGLEKIGCGALNAAVNGRELALDKIRASLDQQADTVELNLRFGLPETGRLRIESAWLPHLPLGHRQYLAIVGQDGHPIGKRLLDAGNSSWEARVDADRSHSSATTFRQFFALGVEHIVTGYDHLLFLLALLIVGSGFVASAKIITSFTAAHSITLGLAAFGLVELPSGFVEPMIAASIVYVGVENLFRQSFERRWLLTFFFGLVHGLGFASVLSELGVGAGSLGVTLPLLSFNLGVEFGQVVLAAILLPLIWKFQHQPTYFAPCARIASVAVVVSGAYWLLERMPLL